jgi:hypothetical protein
MSPDVPELKPTPRLLPGPGPSMVHPRVLRAPGRALAATAAVYARSAA